MTIITGYVAHDGKLLAIGRWVKDEGNQYQGLVRVEGINGERGFVRLKEVDQRISAGQPLVEV